MAVINNFKDSRDEKWIGKLFFCSLSQFSLSHQVIQYTAHQEFSDFYYVSWCPACLLLVFYHNISSAAPTFWDKDKDDQKFLIIQNYLITRPGVDKVKPNTVS